MALTRSFRETVKARADRDPAFRAALLAEAVEAIAGDEVAVSKALLRDYINETTGFEEIGRAIAIDPKNLMRMLGPRGNPQMNNFPRLLAELNRREGIRLRVSTAAVGGP